MKVTPFASVEASAGIHLTSGQRGSTFQVEFAVMESAPKPKNPWASVPPLRRTQISAGLIPGRGLPSEALSTTLIRALFLRTWPPSLFGHARNVAIAPPP